jgi:hypothetical protein
MDAIPKLKPITTKVRVFKQLTDFQEQLLCAAANWCEAYHEASIQEEQRYDELRDLISLATRKGDNNDY